MKGGILCQEKTEQDLQAKGREQVEEWVGEEGMEEAEWVAADLVQARVETVHALIAVRKRRIKREFLVMRLNALRVGQK